MRRGFFAKMYHIASAILADCDFFITVDDRLLTNAVKYAKTNNI